MMKNDNIKGGRPRLEDFKKKTRTIAIRLSLIDYMYVKACTDESGLRLSEFAYRAVMDKEIHKLLTTDEISILSDIRKIGNNLNQLTRYTHLGDDTLTRIRRILDYLTGIIRKVR